MHCLGVLRRAGQLESDDFHYASRIASDDSGFNQNIAQGIRLPLNFHFRNP
jgi:hypothetical protein